VLARSFGIPCVVGLANLLSRLEQGLRVCVDGDLGAVQLRPDPADVDRFLVRLSRRKSREKKLSVHAALPSVTPDGHRFGVHANVEALQDLDTFEARNCDGVGLLRTEFLYMQRKEFPSEDEQYRLYRRVLERMEGRPVTLRTLDIGNDKTLPYFKTPEEANPALGWRGLRISIEWQDLLRVQLRAALRASAHGELRILFPMVTSIEEVRAARRIFSEVRAQLVEQGHDVASEVPFGLMIEVPSTVLSLSHFLRECDFVSVGTNDLVQYLLAVDRDNPWVAKLYDPQHPAVWKALALVAEGASAARKPSSVCGEMAGDYATALLLMGLGFDSVSVVPHLLSELKFAVREIAFSEAKSLAAQALCEDTSAGIGKVLAQARELLHRRHISEDSDDGAFEASPPADGSGAREPA
jgi:phosphotransferase system enzyme I (PtsI)